MKLIHSFIYCLHPLTMPTPRPAAHFSGLLQTLPDLSAIGFPLGTDDTAASCGLDAHHLYTLRTVWRELVASTVSARQVAQMPPA
jgi:hypothetical protein